MEPPPHKHRLQGIAARESDLSSEKVTVVIPCHNEAATVATVVTRFRSILPTAAVLVVDNASTDDTAQVARTAGAVVISESRLGKGFALLTGFAAAADSDYCVMVDGDGTYLADDVGSLLEAASEQGADIVIGTRLERCEPGAFRAGHTFGNRFFAGLVRVLFGIRTRDLFSGYRVLSRRFLDITPLIARGFDVEAEMAVQARMNGFKVVEVPVQYSPRLTDSQSKLRTFSDGYHILRSLMVLLRDYRPVMFFGWLALGLGLMSIWSGLQPVKDFLETGYVYHLPRAVLAAGLFVLCALSLSIGVLLSSINRRSNELAALIRKVRR